MKVGKGSVVGLEYRLHLGDGEAIDESEPGDPLMYLHGEGMIVPGLETALEGLEAGAKKSVVVSPKDGYGEHDARGLQEVSKSSFPKDAKLEKDMTFTAQGDQGEVVEVRVHEVKASSVVVDLNHPLAGKTLHFDVTVQSVRAATAEELEHGHPHGPEGHDHDH